MSGLDESFYWFDKLSRSKGEANPLMMINQLNQNQLAMPLYTQASTSNGVSTHMLYQGNNSPSPQPAAGTSCAPKLPITGRKMPGFAGDPVEKKILKKRLNDKAYRDRKKEGRKVMESKLEELKPENAKLKSKNESLKQEKDLAVKKLHRTNHEKNQLESILCRLRHLSASLRIRVEAFTQKVFAYANVEQQLKQLKDELASLTEKIPWEEEWMSEKLQFLNTREQLKNENRILNVQAKALLEKKYKQREDSVIIRSEEWTRS